MRTATLFTADRVQATVGKAKNMKIIFVEVEQLVQKLAIEKYFDEKTMSVHLRENVNPMAKKGQPGKWEFVNVDTETLDRDVLKTMSREIIEEANVRKEGFVEIERHGSTIVQIENFRVVITRPPFSDGWEITAVRPVRKLSIADYGLSEKLTNRISEAGGRNPYRRTAGTRQDYHCCGNGRVLCFYRKDSKNH